MQTANSQATEAKRNVLAEIAKQVSAWPKLARLAGSLAPKFKPTVADSLRRTSDLACWLYVYEQPALALQICQLLNDLPFEQDYNRWTWVECSLALEWKLRVQAGQLPAAQACVATLQSTYTLGPASVQAINQQGLANRLAGCFLSRVADAEQFGNQAAVRNARFVEIGELLFLQFLGGSAVWPVPALEHRLATHLAILRA